MISYPQEIVFIEDEYAGFPITRFINITRNNDHGLGITRLEGLTIPTGLYYYNREQYKTYEPQTDVSDIEEEQFCLLIDKVKQTPKKTKKTKKNNIKKKTKKTKKTKIN